MSIKTTTKPIAGQNQKKTAAQRKTDKNKTQGKRKAAEKETLLTVEEELGPIAYYTSESEGEFLRQMFDFLESINIKNARKIYYSVPRKFWSLGMALVASLVLIWATVVLVNVVIAQMEWESRPPVMDRLTAPYELDTHVNPTLDLSVAGGILPANVGGYANQLFITDASGVLPEFVDVTANVIVDRSTRFDAVTRGMLYVDNLMGQCLLSAASTATSYCDLPRLARYAEGTTYVSGSDSVMVVAAQYANIEQAAEAFTGLYDFNRLIGVIGNYAMVENRTVDYFYSSSRNNYYFTWTNGTWVYTVNSGSLTALDNFMSEFPY